MNFRITKRQEFVFVTLVLAAGLLVTQLLPDYRYPMAIILSVITYVLSALVLRYNLNGIEFVTLLSLPTFFTLAITLFYFLLPLRWITRIPVVVLYAFAMYGLLLTENIYNVAANRTIALLRAAHTVGFLITLITYFLLLVAIFAFRMNAIYTTVLVGLVSFILVIQILWSVDLGERLGKRIWDITVACVLILMQISWFLAFWSAKTTMKALFLTTVFYSVVGLAQQFLIERMYKKTIIEFSLVTVIVAILFIISTNWRGTF